MKKAVLCARAWTCALTGFAMLGAGASVLAAQQSVTELRDPDQTQDAEFARLYAEWTSDPQYGSPLVDHLPVAEGIPTTKDVLGYYVGAPKMLTYYEDIVRYYRELAAATPRVTVETIGRSDEGRELVVVWISSDDNIAALQQNRDNLARIADPRGLEDDEVQRLLETTTPQYHLMGGLHSGELGPPEMLMELAYRLAVETSPFVSQIRDNVIVSITPVADPDGRDRLVDWFYRNLERDSIIAAEEAAAGDDEDEEEADEDDEDDEDDDDDRRRRVGVPYWGRYVYHDNNRDINLSQVSMRAITDWYYTAHPPIMHDLHESLALLYTYSGGPPQNPNLDPLLFGELRFFSDWELAQMTKWGMPGVYTHAFMDGWSPGYLGSVAYNHNGMMRMYETQSGRDVNVDSLRTARAEEAARDSALAADSASAAGDSARAGGNRQGGAASGAQGGRSGGVPTGRGGSQDREWYRGLPVPEHAVAEFTRRNNTNYMQTGVLLGLQLTAMFPDLVLENFYVKTRNSIEKGRTEAPYAFAIPLQRDMTRVATLLDILRAQGIEIGTLNSRVELESDTLPAGSYIIKLDQPYGRLAKNLLEVQDYPDARLRTYDDSGWTMGYAFDAEVLRIDDEGILDSNTTLIDRVVPNGSVAGSGTAGLAVAHLGSNSMITLLYRLRDMSMTVAEQPFTAEDIEFPIGSFIITGSPQQLQAASAVVDSLGLTGAMVSSVPAVAVHDADAPRIAIYSQWNGTQELGWYRHAFDRFGIPYDLIYKERVVEGNLEADYDVIVMASQDIDRENVLEDPAERPQPYRQTDRFRFLGMYGETDDMTGGFGVEGVRALQYFLQAGRTLITAHDAVQFPIEFGLARTMYLESPEGVSAQKPLVLAKISRMDHPVFYGHPDSIFPIKYGQGSQVFRVGIADESNVLARYVGGDDAVLSGLMTGADNIADRAFVADVPNAYNGRGRVIMFANNPIYRWQNHGEFGMVFNAIINWNDVPPPLPLKPNDPVAEDR
ncbi:MAG TPA: M14 family zinc carboxypeptidase [Longimicrobiales bacterium]|nr:M14 family zinc carboxypeptidase [Longimicrobiales bacterium]